MRRRSFLIAIVILLGLNLLLIGCNTQTTENSNQNSLPSNESASSPIACADSTLIENCSKEQPHYCTRDAKLVNRSTRCGCPEGYTQLNDSCTKNILCSDGTSTGACSNQRPYYCENGILVKNMNRCACLPSEIVQENECIEAPPRKVVLPYTVRGVMSSITIYLNESRRDVYEMNPHYTDCAYNCPSYTKQEEEILNESRRDSDIQQLVDRIKEKTTDKDEQARIAVSVVQNIPYDELSFRNGSIRNKYPYEVLYTNKGVCGEKTRLLALMLQKLGFGVNEYIYEIERHEALGIKCPRPVSYTSADKDYGYCFVESTTPSIITDSSGNYIGFGKLASKPLIIPVTDGKSFDTAGEEYTDAQQFEQAMYKYNNNIALTTADYLILNKMNDKYGFSRAEDTGSILDLAENVSVIKSDVSPYIDSNSEGSGQNGYLRLVLLNYSIDNKGTWAKVRNITLVIDNTGPQELQYPSLNSVLRNEESGMDQTVYNHHVLAIIVPPQHYVVLTFELNQSFSDINATKKFQIYVEDHSAPDLSGSPISITKNLLLN